MDGKVVFMNGFSNEEAVAIMRAAKAASADPQDIAFCVATERNLDWKVRELIEDVRADHEYLKANPPQRAGGKPA
jgi:hypothetical protein